MGKLKKGRKGAKDDESNSDVEIETQDVVETKNGKKSQKLNKKTVDIASDEEVNEKVGKKKKGKTQKGKKHDETESEDDEPTPKNINVKKINNKKTAKNAKNKDDESGEEQVPVSKFALLQVDSDLEVAESDNEVTSDSEVKVVKKDNSKKNNPKESESRTKEGKKSKKNRKKRDDSDDDLEKALAELALEHGLETNYKPKEEAVVAEKEDESKEKKIKGKKDKEEVIPDDVLKTEDVLSTVKSAAQKKKEKKEREKLKKKQEDQPKLVGAVAQVEDIPADAENEPEAENIEKESKKKKKKGSKADEKEKEPKKGPTKKAILQMQELLRKTQEEEEKFLKQEQERIRKEEEAEEARLEALRLEKERKEKKKQREKERKERLKAEGKYLTPKQKAERLRAQAMIDNLKAQGIELPDVGEKKPRLGTRIKPSKLKQQKSTEKELQKVEEKPLKEKVEEVVKIEQVPTVVEVEDDVKDAWDATSEEEDEESEEVSTAAPDIKAEAIHKSQKEESDEGSEDSTEEDSEEEEEEEDHKTDAEKRRERAKNRMEQRAKDAEKSRTVENLRAAVVCVLGHVDTGKTKILDKLRRTNVQDGEAGGITQQIGATNVPIHAIKEQIKHVKGYSAMEFKLPGLLIIDTPGHESFSNLRSRGSSLCDIAILVVDIMHGLEPQTIESLNLLKNKKTPFVVALNKIDRLYDWQTLNRRDISDIIKGQASNTKLEFDQRTNEVIVQFAEQGLNAALCYENPDERTYVSLVPTSAVTGEGMGNLLSLIVDYCQNRLPKRLMFSEELQATVLEVKAIPGLGTTIDAILINGTLKEGDTMILAGTEGPITTQIRSLLMPQPMKELRVKNAYVEYKKIDAAQGVKIAAKELEKAIAGLNLYVAQHQDEVDLLNEVVAKELKSALSGIKLQDRGVYVQASTLGSLEALLEFLRTSKIPYSGIRIGPVVKRDVMKASTMLEHESQYATILAFDVKIERDAQDLADNLGVRIFQADIIYHLFDKFMSYTAELKAKKREEFKNIAVFPCKLRILPDFVFNSRDPIVMGVIVENGIVKEGTPLCVITKEAVTVDIGIVTGLEVNHKNVELARKGMEVCVKIEPIPGESPKMFGRHFDASDFLISKISRQSIDACKEHFREDLTKTDWALMVELKKMFQIL